MPEEVLVRLRTHPKILVGPVVVQIVLIACHVGLVAAWPTGGFGVTWIDDWGPLALHAVVVVLEIAYAIIPVLRWWMSICTVTTRRVVRQWGIAVRRTYEIPIDRIVSVTTERGILDRIFGCGTLVLHDAGYAPNSTAGVRFHDVPRVENVQDIIDDLRRETS